MSEGPLLQIDDVTKTLVGTNTNLPGLYHPEINLFRVQIVESGDLGSSLTVQDKSASALRMIISTRPTANPAADSVLIYAEAGPGSWAWNVTTQLFEGGIDLDTAPLQLALHDDPSINAYLYILLTTDGVEKVIYGPSGSAANITINATPASSSATAAAPTPADDYNTKTEDDQRFQRLLHGNGSPQGVIPATVSQIYWQDDADKLWVKKTGSGNTGWFALVG